MAITYPTKWQTTEAYLSGGICGTMWMPAAVAGFHHRVNLRGHWGIMADYGTFREALDHELMRRGGDFQNGRFTADTEIVIIRRRFVGAGRYEIHSRTIPVERIDPDLINTDVYTSDVFGEC